MFMYGIQMITSLLFSDGEDGEEDEEEVQERDPGLPE
jgi:hypothetical protein